MAILTHIAAAPSQCSCGIPNRGENSSSRVIGGQETGEHEWPWQVGLEFHVDGGRIRWVPGRVIM